jgi:hypothetical protein
MTKRPRRNHSPAFKAKVASSLSNWVSRQLFALHIANESFLFDGLRPVHGISQAVDNAIQMAAARFMTL